MSPHGHKLISAYYDTALGAYNNTVDPEDCARLRKAFVALERYITELEKRPS